MSHDLDELSRATGLAPDDLRRLERAGLLPAADDADGGARRRARAERLARLAGLGLDADAIARLLGGDDEAVDDALAAALGGPAAGGLTRAELAERAGLPDAVLRAAEREGLLLARPDGGYDEADVRAARAGAALLGAGVPLDELLRLARDHREALRAMAVDAVDVFARFVRDPLRAEADEPADAAARAAEAVGAMLPATGDVVAHHLRRLLVAEAVARMADDELGPDG